MKQIFKVEEVFDKKPKHIYELSIKFIQKLEKRLNYMYNFQIIDYVATPESQFHLGLCTVLVDGGWILVFAHKNKKDGSGTFFCSQSYKLEKNGEKRFLPDIKNDSRAKDEALMDFLRANWNKKGQVLAQGSVLAQQPKAKSMDEVQFTEQCPF